MDCFKIWYIYCLWSFVLLFKSCHLFLSATGLNSLLSCFWLFKLKNCFMLINYYFRWINFNLNFNFSSAIIKFSKNHWRHRKFQNMSENHVTMKFAHKFYFKIVPKSWYDTSCYSITKNLSVTLVFSLIDKLHLIINTT